MNDKIKEWNEKLGETPILLKGVVRIRHEDHVRLLMKSMLSEQEYEEWLNKIKTDDNI